MYGQSDSSYSGRVTSSLTQLPLNTSHPSNFPISNANFSLFFSNHCGGRSSGRGEVELELLAEDTGKVFTKDGDEEDEDHESEEVWGEARFPEDGGGRVGRRRHKHVITFICISISRSSG